MKVKTKVKLILLLMLVFVSLLTIRCCAASISISPSKKSVTPGETFTVTVTANDATGKINMSVSNGTVSKSSAWVENNSVSFDVTAGSSGTVGISVSGDVANNSGVDQKVSGSSSVSIRY